MLCSLWLSAFSFPSMLLQIVKKGTGRKKLTPPLGPLLAQFLDLSLGKMTRKFELFWFWRFWFLVWNRFWFSRQFPGLITFWSLDHGPRTTESRTKVFGINSIPDFGFSLFSDRTDWCLSLCLWGRYKSNLPFRFFLSLFVDRWPTSSRTISAHHVKLSVVPALF